MAQDDGRTRPIRIAIADGPRSRAGVRALLATWPNGVVIGEAATGTEALDLVRATRPDVVLLDAELALVDGMTATRIIKAHWPEVRVIVMSIDDRYESAAGWAGADAFVAKGHATTRLLAALEAIEVCPLEEPR